MHLLEVVKSLEAFSEPRHDVPKWTGQIRQFNDQ